MIPPKVGPRAGPAAIPIPYITLAIPNFFGGKVCASIVCERVIKAPPPNPCTKRQSISSHSSVELPHINDANVKSKIENVKYLLQPKSSDSIPLNGMMMTFDMA